MSRNLRAVLFDLDGTLADTAPDLARAVNAMRLSRSLDPLALGALRPFVSSGARGMIGAAFGVLPENEGYEAMREEFLDLYAGNLCVDTRMFPEMPELLERLEAEGMPWGVVTNKAERFARPLMEALGLGARSRVVVGGDTCSRAKPHPDSLLHAAGILAVEPAAILYVGDDIRDVQAARAAGMPVIAAAYGYLGDGPLPQDWGADAIVHSPAGIADWAGL